MALTQYDTHPGYARPLIIGLCLVSVGVILGFIYQMNQKPAQLAPQKYAMLQAQGSAALPESALESEDRLLGLPAAPERPYFVFGADTGGADWEAGREAMLERRKGGLRLTAGEMNTWMRRSFSRPQGAEDGAITVVPGLPNFFVGEGRLHVSMPMELAAVNQRKDYRLIVRGHFTENNAFQIEDLLLGGAEVPPIPGLRELIVQRMASAFLTSDEGQQVAGAFDDALAISIQDDVLLLEF